MRSVFGEENV